MSGQCILSHHLIGDSGRRFPFYSPIFVNMDQLLSLQVGLLLEFRCFPS
jgi:hypothetical protein